eukprot:gene15243-18042_t
MQYSLVLIAALVLCAVASTEAKKAPRYVNWVPFAGVNCTGPETGHGTSYLLNHCIPFESYSLIYSSNATHMSTVYFFESTNCTGSPYNGGPSKLGQCFRFVMGYNQVFYSYPVTTRKAIKAPKDQVCLYRRSYRDSDSGCDQRFLWSKYVTNATSWLLTKDLRETLYCNPTNFHPIEHVCNTTGSWCQTTDLKEHCDWFAQQTAYVTNKCVHRQSHNHDSEDSDDEDYAYDAESIATQTVSTSKNSLDVDVVSAHATKIFYPENN